MTTINNSKELMNFHQKTDFNKSIYQHFDLVDGFFTSDFFEERSTITMIFDTKNVRYTLLLTTVFGENFDGCVASLNGESMPYVNALSNIYELSKNRKTAQSKKDFDAILSTDSLLFFLTKNYFLGKIMDLTETNFSVPNIFTIENIQTEKNSGDFVLDIRFYSANQNYLITTRLESQRALNPLIGISNQAGLWRLSSNNTFDDKPVPFCYLPKCNLESGHFDHRDRLIKKEIVNKLIDSNFVKLQSVFKPDLIPHLKRHLLWIGFNPILGYPKELK